MPQELNKTASAPSWASDCRVPALLAALQKTPPGVRWLEVPAFSSLFCRKRVWQYVHPAIDELNWIYNEYFCRLFPTEINRGCDAYMAARSEFREGCPTVDDLVRQALADRVAA